MCRQESFGGAREEAGGGTAGPLGLKTSCRFCPPYLHQHEEYVQTSRRNLRFSLLWRLAQTRWLSLLAQTCWLWSVD